MKRTLFIMVALCVSIHLTSSVVRAAEPASAQSKKTAASAKMKDLSKEEMVARLKGMIEDHPDLRSEIRGLTVKEVGGKKVYEYNGKKLEDLDKDTILNLLMASSRFITIQNTQRIQKQMKAINQVENMNRVQSQINPPKIPSPPPSVPKIYTPPKTYKAPGK